MKYSVFQYSQERLLEYNLDVTDAFLLQWFSDFFMCGSMEKKIFKEGDKNKIYGWVKLSKVMEDLPCIGISTEKGIKRRFDNLVEKGILERTSLITQNGKKTYYKPTELYETLINTKISSNSNKLNNKPDNNKENSSHDYSSSHAEKNSSHRTKTTYADSNNKENSSHDYSSSHAEGHFNGHGQGNENSLALKDSTTINSSTTDAAYIHELSDKYFGKNKFDSQFYQQAAVFFEKHKIQKQHFEGYLKFIYEKAINKKPESFRDYSYIIFFKEDVLQEYLDIFDEKEKQNKLEQEENKKQEARKIICPVCNNRFLPDYTDSCPNCSFELNKFQNQKEIEKHIKYYNLPAQKKLDYEEEIKNIYMKIPAIELIRNNNQKVLEFENMTMKIDKKYGLI